MGTPIRVLHVVVNMNRGGAETLIMNLYRNIDRSEVQFDFLTCKMGVFDEEIIELGGTIHRIPYLTEGGHFNYIKNLNEFFKKHSEYMIVHAHMDKMSGFVMREAKKARISVRIAHSHNTQSEGGFTAKLYKYFAGRNISKFATHYMACSNRAADWLFKNKSKSSILLKNGIEIDKFTYSQILRDQIRDQLGIEKDSLVIGHVGRFCHQKNHSFLIEIFNELLKKQSNSILILVGGGPLRSKIEEQARVLNIEDRVKFLGIRSDINHLLQAFDIFAFPSHHEGLPVTLIEAQSAGLPCVISDGITKEVDMGIQLVEYAPLNNKRSWVERIEKMTSNNNMRSIASQALSIKGYDIKSTSEWTKNYYLAILR